MSARTELAAQLKAALPGYAVIGYPREPVGRKTIAIVQKSLQKTEEFGIGWLRVTIELWVLSGQDDPNKADDALDDALLEVVEALQPIDWVEWSEAERTVADEIQAHTYKFQLTALARVTPLEA